MRESSRRRGGRSVGAGRGADRVRLSELVPEARFIGCDDIVVSGCQFDARRCRPGDVFIARVSDRGDGHEAVAEALSRGAVGVVAERMVPTGGVPLCLVHDTSWVYARLVHALAQDPSRRMRVIAVTGTSGKTTTAWLAAAALVEAGHRVGVVSDLGVLGPDDTQPAPLASRTACDVAAALARLADEGCTHVVMEVSSRMLADHAMAGVEFDTVAVTGLAAAHLDRHATGRAYRRIIARSMQALRDGGCLVTGVSEAGRRRLVAAAPGDVSVLTAGLSESFDVHARAIEGSLHGRTFLLVAGGQMMPIAADNPTVAFVRNAALAAGIAARYGISLQHAARGIEAAGGVPGRLERIDRGQDAAVFHDTPTTMHSVAASLASLRRLTEEGRLAVLVDERLARRLAGTRFARSISRWADDCIEVPESVLAENADSHSLAAYARIDRLLAAVRRGDCVVVLGRGLVSPDGSGDDRDPLAALVDGWLQLSLPAEPPFGLRRAA